MAARSATVASRIRTGPGIAPGRRTFPFQRLDVPFHLQEDREERQDRRVEVGAITRGARVLPRFVQEPIEHLAVFLPQCTAIVRPVVQDRFEVQAVRRDRAAHASPTARHSAPKNERGGDDRNYSPAPTPMVARLIRTNESLSGSSPPRRISRVPMPSKAAEALAPSSRGSATAMLVILTLAGVLLSAPPVRAAAF